MAKTEKEEKDNETQSATKATENNGEVPKKVRVICKETLGHLLLTEGDTTDDPQYVALLKTKRGKTLVQEVK